MLAATAILSQFFRSSNSVIGPELIRDLSLSSEALGFANGCFFAALLLVQIPVGIAFDRIGPRLTVGVLSVLMTAGALLHAAAQSGAELALARFVVGLGCAGSFMAGVVLISRWYPRPSWATVLSWLFALSQFGLLLAGLPLAIATETIGWRVTFVIMGVIAALVGVLFLADRARPAAGASRQAERAGRGPGGRPPRAGDPWAAAGARPVRGRLRRVCHRAGAVGGSLSARRVWPGADPARLCTAGHGRVPDGRRPVRWPARSHLQHAQVGGGRHRVAVAVDADRARHGAPVADRCAGRAAGAECVVAPTAASCWRTSAATSPTIWPVAVPPPATWRNWRAQPCCRC